MVTLRGILMVNGDAWIDKKYTSLITKINNAYKLNCSQLAADASSVRSIDKMGIKSSKRK